MGNKIKALLKRYFVDAMSAMALGLFASLVVSLIISQIAKIPGLDFLTQITSMASAKSSIVGAAVGAAVAWGLKASPLTIFASVVTGAVGYGVGGIGGPVGAYLAAVVGAECARLVAGKTKFDIILTPFVTIITGGIVGILAGPPVQSFMSAIGSFIVAATEMAPFVMGIIVSLIIGMSLTSPISSAALCMMLGLSGIAAGAATIGCCAQMVGFGVASFKDNGWGALLAQGFGTSKLQLGNVLKRPQIWIAPTLAGVILAPISTCFLKMTNIPEGAGMGTSGLVGQFGTFTSMMADGVSFPVILIEVIIMHFVAPILLTLFFTHIFRKVKLIKPGDMKLADIK